MGRRRQARECALQALYLCDTSGMSVDEALLSVRVGADLDAPTTRFAEGLALGADKDRKKIDTRLSQLAENWSLERMAAVDRNLLRMAAFELIRGETPRSVIIDEALEIAKNFSSGDSSRFINGILDRITAPERPRPKTQGGKPRRKTSKK